MEDVRLASHEHMFAYPRLSGCGSRPRCCCRRDRGRTRRSSPGGRSARSPGAPLSRYPAAVASRWKRSTTSFSVAANAMCTLLGRRIARDDRERAAEAGEERPVCELASDVEARGRRDGLVEARRGLEVGDADPEVIDDRSLAQRAVVHGFGAVAVRVEEERAVVVVAVLRTQPGRAVVWVARGGTRLPELVDVSTRRGGEADVQPPRHRRSRRSPARARSRPTRGQLARVRRSIPSVCSTVA